LFLHGFSFTWVDIDIVVDTGAAITCLSPRDAVRVGVPQTTLADPSRWQSVESYSGVGGDTTYLVVPTWYRFLHEDGTTQHVDAAINIMPRLPQTQQMPSLLGWDVLAQFRLTMDWSQRSVELHESTA
jgi:hypothetical protein